MLATLAIIVWHLYGVIFDPDAYPMNWAWYDGRMSIEHYEHEHPLDARAMAEVGSEAAGDDAEPKDIQPIEKIRDTSACRPCACTLEPRVNSFLRTTP